MGSVGKWRMTPGPAILWIGLVAGIATLGSTVEVLGLADTSEIYDLALAVLVLGGAAPLAARKAHRADDRLAKAWWCIAAACGWWGIGQAAGIVEGVLGPMGSSLNLLADVGFNLAIPFFLAGIVLYPMTRDHPFSVLSAAVDAAVLFVLLTSYLYLLEFRTLFDGANSDFFEIATVAVCPLGDLLILSVGVTIYHRRGGRFRSQFCLILWAILALSIADFGFLYLEFGTAGSSLVKAVVAFIAGVGWIVCFSALSYAAVLPEPNENQSLGSRMESARWNALLYALLLPMVVGLATLQQTDGNRSGIEEILLAVVLLLLIIRAILAERENRVMVDSLAVSVATLKRRETVLSFQATHDVLTTLANRAELRRMIQAAINEHPDRVVAVVFIDLDNFKVVNDQLGHEVGDALLVAIGERLRFAVGREGLTARLGGDEFGIFVGGPDASERGAMVAAQVIEVFSTPFSVRMHDLSMSASVGLTAGIYTGVSEVLKDADLAMYEAKARGKSQVALFDQQMGRRRDVESDLMDRIMASSLTDELLLHYQPLIDLATGHVCGQEALVRWQHPERGLLQPADFIGLAERTGSIVAVGWWVMQAACAEAATWIDPSTVVSVNVAAHQLLHPDAALIIEEILAKCGLDPRRLMVEVTESVMVDFGVIGPCLDDLRSRGVQVAIDDFGTGYSSLSYLTTLPVDVVKIDQSFIAALGGDAKGDLLVRSLVEMTKNLGLRTVAEGVETRVQLERLRAIGCDAAQGFLLARPLSTPVFHLPDVLPFGDSVGGNVGIV